MLTEIIKLSQNELFVYMEQFLKENYSNVIKSKNNKYLIAVGAAPVALVAHLDTVFLQYPEELFWDKAYDVLWCPTGAGFDDRAGVAAIIEIVTQSVKDLLPSVILTTDEEKGNLGSLQLIKDFPNCPILKLNYIIQLDRQGKNDCVFYSLDNPQFQSYIESYSFITAFGSYSDISVLAPAWGVAAVNLSIGYIDEHSLAERLYYEYYNQTVIKVEQMIADSFLLTEPFIYKEKSITCDFCNKKLSNNWIRVAFNHEIDLKICYQCSWKYTENFYLCPKCKTYNFITDNEGICYSCN